MGTPQILWAGASGYAFKEWKGSFYPEKITPEAFRFAIKASRRITHDARIAADAAADSVAYLYKNLAALGAKRGPAGSRPRSGRMSTSTSCTSRRRPATQRRC